MRPKNCSSHSSQKYIEKCHSSKDLKCYPKVFSYDSVLIAKRWLWVKNQWLDKPSFTAVEILKAWQIFKWCHCNVVIITFLPSDLADGRCALYSLGPNNWNNPSAWCSSLALDLAWLVAALWYVPVMSYLIK